MAQLRLMIPVGVLIRESEQLSLFEEEIYAEKREESYGAYGVVSPRDLAAVVRPSRTLSAPSTFPLNRVWGRFSSALSPHDI